MSTGKEAYEQADIRLGEVIWSKTMPANEAVKQQKHLADLAGIAKAGVILDCALVDVTNSELLSLIVRVRTLAKKQKKGFALFNVPENLSKTIKLCKLESVLPIANDMVEAKKLAYDLSRGKGGLIRALKKLLGK